MCSCLRMKKRQINAYGDFTFRFRLKPAYLESFIERVAGPGWQAVMDDSKYGEQEDGGT